MLALKSYKSFIKSYPSWLHVVGSISRNEPEPKDIDLISTKSLQDTAKFFCEEFNNKGIDSKVYESSDKKLSFIINVKNPKTKKNIKFNIWFSSKKDLPFFILAFSYPTQFNIAIRKKAKNLGLTLSQYGLYKGKKKLNNVKKKN